MSKMKYSISGTVKNTSWEELGSCLLNNSSWQFSEMEEHEYFELTNENFLVEIRLSDFPSIAGKLSFWFTGTYNGSEKETKKLLRSLEESLTRHNIPYYFTFFDKSKGRSNDDTLVIHPNWNN
jgi:hypothetical protein